VAIHRAALRGLVGMVAARVPTAEPERSGRPTRPLRPEEIGEYETADGVRLSIWPGSVLARERPEWILAGEIVETQRRWARTVAPIRARWIERLAPHLLRRETFEPHLVAETGQVAAWERTSLGGLVVVPRRRVPFGPIDPEAARQVFIAAGLVEGRWRTRGSFRVRNNRLLERIAEAEARTRRPAGILRETLVHRFYEQRVPAWVHSGPAFESWRREAERAHPEVLRMRVSDLAGDRELPSPQAFPEALMVETPGCPPLRLPLRYRHEPGHLEDGVVARVPLEALPRVERHGDGRLGWLVPGLLEEKIRGVLRALPKALRARIGTVREVAAALHADLEPTRRGGAVHGALWPPLAEALQRRIGEPISAELLEATLPRLEPHLRLGLELVDGHGGVLEFRREGDPWSRRWSEEDAGGDAVPQRLDSTAAAWTIDRLDRLPDAAVPRVVTIRSGGIEVPMHPTLSVAAPAEGPGILSLRLCGDESEALGEWREALVALFRREAAEALRHHLEYHPRGEAVIAAWSDLLAPAAPESIRDAIETLAAASCFDPDPRSVRDHRAFERRLEQASPALFPHLDETLQRLGEAAAIAADLTERLQAPAPAAWAEAVAAIELRRSDLLRIDPGAAFPQRLALLPDSLDALRQRIERLRGAGPQRDHEEEAIAAAWQGRIEALRWHRSDPRRQALLQLVDRWWIGVLAPKRVRGERVSQREVEAAIAAAA
jgi:ATP-dependent helicase HrpA